MSGQSRATMTSAEWHQKNPTAIEILFGGQFRTFDYFLVYTAVLFPELKIERSDASQNETLTEFERYCIAVMFCKTDRNERELALAWGVGRKVIGRTLQKWMPRLGKVGKDLSRHLLDYDFVKKFQPKGFPERYGQPVAMAKDGTDFLTDTPRRRSLEARLLYGHKNDQQGGRAIVWSTPNGASIFATEVFCARGGEQRLVEAHRRWLFNIPKGTCYLIDRGFEHSGQHYPHFNRAHIPAFKRKRKRFQRREVENARKISQDRYTSETYNARVKAQKVIKGQIQRHRFQYVNDAANWGHGMANLYRPLVNPGDWKDYLARQVKEAREPLV